MALERTEDSENKTPEISTEGLDQKAINDQLIAQMAEMSAQIASYGAPDKKDDDDRILKAIELMTARTDFEKFSNAYTRPEDIDPEDVLSKEEAVTFFAHTTQYVIVDDKRGGHSVRTPFHNTILFNYESTKEVRSGKDIDLYSTCVYTSISKKEVQWLKEHTFYNTVFFDSRSSDMGGDAIYATLISKAMKSLQNIDAHQIMQMTKAAGMEPSQDLTAMRTELAVIQAKKGYEDYLKAGSTMVYEASKDQLMLNSNVAPA